MAEFIDDALVEVDGDTENNDVIQAAQTRRVEDGEESTFFALKRAQRVENEDGDVSIVPRKVATLRDSVDNIDAAIEALQELKEEVEE